MLLLPHNNKIELMNGFGSAKDAFMAKHALLNTAMQTYSNFLRQVESAIRRIRLQEAELNEVTDNINQSSECNFDAAAAMFPNGANSFCDVQHRNTGNPDDDLLQFHEIHGCRMTHAQFEENCNRMTTFQKKVMNYIHHFFLRQNR